jgi:endo-1,4-beta-xylanase
MIRNEQLPRSAASSSPAASASSHAKPPPTAEVGVISSSSPAADRFMMSALTLEETDFAGTPNTPTTTTLKDVLATACKHVTIGTAIMPFQDKEPQYAATIASEFNAVVIEHHLKWTPLCVSEPGPLPDETPCPRLGKYDFYYADQMVDWAIQHGLRVKGHVLVWHVTSPTALLQNIVDTTSSEELRNAIKQHIYTVMGHYKGRIQDWDVVNEALAPDGSIAENLFQQVLGNEYIADCFRWAHDADPNARLFYNDNKVEGIGTPKADAFYNLVADLQAEGVPIHGVGMQAHFKGGGVGRQAVPTPRQVKQQIHRLGKLGLVVHFSEMDVRVGTFDTPALRDAAQTQIYHDIIAAALSEPALEAIYFWGFTDKHTWIHEFYDDADEEDETPLLFDKHYRRKPAYYAVRQALQSLTPQGRVGGEGVLLDSDVDVEGNIWGHTWRSTLDGLANADHPLSTLRGDDRPDWLQTKSDIGTDEDEDEDDVEEGVDADDEDGVDDDDDDDDEEDAPDDEKTGILLDGTATQRRGNTMQNDHVGVSAGMMSGESSVDGDFMSGDEMTATVEHLGKDIPELT